MTTNDVPKKYAQPRTDGQRLGYMRVSWIATQIAHAACTEGNAAYSLVQAAGPGAEAWLPHQPQFA